ncbi:hypothetical protein C8Q76DRAFT_798195 [Earliella scabrosa]|nr:hypothetical protein C8Q76DRAFT_798195 [Earliella scabrosa]
MPVQDPSFLTKAEKTYLEEHVYSYRQTPHGDKEKYRLRMTKHLMTMRNLRDDDKYAEICIFKKVTNFLSNSRQGKKTRLPRRIVQHYTPKRVFALAEADKIKAAVAEEVEETSDHYIKIWNETWTRLWEELSDEARKKWIALCNKFNEVGPDDEYKSEIAERRALAWMRAVCEMFWDQCKLALFMYGMFEDKQGEFRGVVYDVSQMLHRKDPNVPLFRDMKAWDSEFRENFWSFFPSVLNPEKSTEKSTELHETLRKKSSKPKVVFETYEDGTPILFNRDPNGNSLTTKMCKSIIREYMSIHHQWAGGKESLRRQPWSLFKEHPDKFFAPGMLPEGVLLYDPEHMPAEHLPIFLDHIVTMENPAAYGLDDEPRRFRLSAYRDGTGDEAVIRDAEYRNPAPSAVKKAKPAAEDNASSYDNGPDADGTDMEDVARRALKSRGGRGRSDKRAALSRLAKATQEYTRELGKAKKAVRQATGKSKGGKKAAGKGKTKARRGQEEAEAEWSKSDASDSDEEGWRELQGGGSSSDEGDGLSDEDLDEDLAAVESTIGGAASDDDEEVEAEHVAAVEEDAFESGPPSRIERLSKAGSKTLAEKRQEHAVPVSSSSRLHPAASVPAAVTRSKAKGKARASGDPVPTFPAGVASNGDARYAFLWELSAQQAYRDMLERLHPMLLQAVKVTGREPVKWATWAMSASHIPKSVHERSDALNRILGWLKEGPTEPISAEVAQRYCLTMGLLLRDIIRVQMIENPDELPDDIPSFFATSSLDFKLVDELMNICGSVKLRPPPPRARARAPPEPVSGPSNAPTRAAQVPPRSSPTSPRVSDDEDGAEDAPAAETAKETRRKRARSDTTPVTVPGTEPEPIGRRTRGRQQAQQGPGVPAPQAGPSTPPRPAKRGRLTRASRGTRK